MGGVGLRKAGSCLLVGTLALAPVPALALADGLELQRLSDGAAVRIEAGAPALHLVFFALWCPPCVDELARLTELDARWSERGYRLILVAVPTRQTRERLLAFARDHDVPGELLFHADGSVQAALSADGLPTHVVLDASGREVVRAGDLGDEVTAAVEGLLAHRRSSSGGGP